MNLRRTIVLCLGLVLLGAGALYLIFNSEPTTQREDAVRQSAMLVDVITPQTGDFRPVIQALGSVRPVREVSLSSQVAGEVVEVSTQLVPGGFVRKGDVLLKIEDADYRNTLLQRQSELLQAEAELELEQGRALQAEREYRELKKDRGESFSSQSRELVLRQPQLRSAQARVAAAQAAQAQASLALERTIVRAPFDAQVIDRSINLGSQASTGQALAELVGIDSYWVEATVPLDRLQWMVFSSGGPEDGSPVRINHRNAWAPGQFREAWLDRLVGELEGGTRLARVLVRVDDPLARLPQHEGQPSLIIGAFVEAQIQGREISGALKLPRELIRRDQTVWLMREEVLVIQPVDIIFEDSKFAYIEGGLNANDKVITTNLATVKEGIRLRLRTAGGEIGEEVAAQP